VAAAIEAQQAYIGSQAGNPPVIAAAGVLFLKAHLVADPYF